VEWSNLFGDDPPARPFHEFTGLGIAGLTNLPAEALGLRHSRQLTKVRQLCETLSHLLNYMVDVRAWHHSRQLLGFFDKRCFTTQRGFDLGKFVEFGAIDMNAKLSL
jgi:hypothetical protein